MFKPQQTSSAENSDTESPKEERVEAMPPYDKWKDAFEKLLVHMKFPRNFSHKLDRFGITSRKTPTNDGHAYRQQIQTIDLLQIQYPRNTPYHTLIS